MKERRQFLTDQYHFIAEMMFISIVVLIPIHYYYDWIWGWNTFLPAIPLCLIFYWLEVKGVEYKQYYFIVPFLFMTYLLLKFTVFVSLILSVLIIWRYLRIRQLLVSGREAFYIFITGVASLLAYLITKETMSIIFFFFQLLIVIFGFMYSHVAVMEKKKESWFAFRFSLNLLSFLIVGGLIAYWISTQSYLLSAWNKVEYTLLSLVGRVTYLFQFLENFFSEMIGEGDSEITLIEQPKFEEDGFNLISLFAMSYFIIGLIIAIICVFILMKILKRDPSSHEGTGGRGVIGFLTNNLTTTSNFLKRFKYRRIGVKHPVRKLVHEFERKAIKNKVGRKKSETLREWFTRIGLQVDVNTYQKVRYGKMDVTEQEINQLKMELNRYKDN